MTTNYDDIKPGDRVRITLEFTVEEIDHRGFEYKAAAGSSVAGSISADFLNTYGKGIKVLSNPLPGHPCIGFGEFGGMVLPMYCDNTGDVCFLVESVWGHRDDVKNFREVTP